MRLTALGLLCVLGLASVGGAAAAALPGHQVPVPAAGPIPGPTPSGSDKVTFGIGPSSPQGVDGRTFFNFQANPGSVFNDHVAVVNSAPIPLTFSVYPVDGLRGGDGFTLQSANVPSEETGAWISVQLPGGGVTLTVAARSTQVIPFSLAIPADASPGDHNGAIIVSLGSQGKNAQGATVNFDQRVAARTLIRVSGPLEPRLEVRNLRVVYHQNYIPLGRGRVYVSYTLFNAGNVKIGAHQRVSLKGLLGGPRLSAPIPDAALLFPGASAHVATRIAGVWPELVGRGAVQVAAFPAPEDVDPNLPAVTTTRTILALPITFLMLVVIVAAMVAWRRRRRSKGGGGAHSFGGPRLPEAARL